MVESKRHRQQMTRCTRVKLLRGGRVMILNQIWPSVRSRVVVARKMFSNAVNSASVAMGRTRLILPSDWSRASQSLQKHWYCWLVLRFVIEMRLRNHEGSSPESSCQIVKYFKSPKSFEMINSKIVERKGHYLFCLDIYKLFDWYYRWRSPQ